MDVQEFYKKTLIDPIDSVSPWTSENILISAIISIIGLTIFGIYVVRCYKVK